MLMLMLMLMVSDNGGDGGDSGIYIYIYIVSRHLATITKYSAHLHHTLTSLKRHFPVSLVAS